MTIWSLIGLAAFLVALAFGLRGVVQRMTVYEYQHAVRFDRGRYSGVLTPGCYWIFTPSTTIRVLDARPSILTIPGQELLSSDGVALKVSLLLEARIADPRAASLTSANHQESLYASAQTALRSAIGERSIEAILESRNALATQLRTEVEPAASALGLELRAISIKDIMFPGSLKEAFSQTARARQEGQAALERARGETAALRNLANAARMLDSNPNLFQLRLLLQAASSSGKLVLNLTPPEGVRTNAESASND